MQSSYEQATIQAADQDCYMHFVAFRLILSSFAFHLIISAQNSYIWFDYIEYFLVIFRIAINSLFNPCR
jgi:hypothetical protein